MDLLNKILFEYNMGYYFKLPAMSDLTIEQGEVLEERKPLCLTGGPGTGKTVVSLIRHIRNYELYKKRSLLLTYTKTLEFYLKIVARKENRTAAENINRTLKWVYQNENSNIMYDEIIIDEAQDVTIDKYRIIKNHAHMVSFGADDAQKVYSAGSSFSLLEKLFTDNEFYEFHKNFRNTKEIMNFTKSLLPRKKILGINDIEKEGPRPFMKNLGRYNYETKEVDAILEICSEYSEETHNIAILVPIKKRVNELYSNLKDKIKCSKYHSDMENCDEIERIHITTLKSSKGLEFDTIIMPGFEQYSKYIKENNSFSDNDYYVAFTRSRCNLFLLCRKEIELSTNNTYQTY